MHDEQVVMLERFLLGTHLELDLPDLLHDGGVRLLDGLAHGVLGDAALLVEARFITACGGE